MSLSYEEALSTLQSMFSDQGYTDRHLDAVLRHHGGHMENTVETLLLHGDGTPDALMGRLSRTTGDGACGRGVDVDSDAEVARRLAAEDDLRHPPRRHGMGGGGRRVDSNRGSGRSSIGSDDGAGGDRSSVTGGTRGTPAVLPLDFLRIPGRKYPATATETSSASSSSSTGSSFTMSGIAGQVMTDEQLARMLQDELFQEELRSNPEFSHLAGRRNPRATAHAPWGAGGAGGQTTGRSNYGGAGGVVSNDILEGLSSKFANPNIPFRLFFSIAVLFSYEMVTISNPHAAHSRHTSFAFTFSLLELICARAELGDTAKRRFQDLAASWNDPNRNSNQSQRPLFGGFGGAGGTRDGHANRGNERRGLLSSDLNMEEDEEEMNFVGVGEGGGRDVEMNSVGRGDKKKD